MGFFDATTIDKEKKEEEDDEKCGTKEFSKLLMAPRVVGWLCFLQLQLNKKKKKKMRQ
jgi:hypothetical protein